jgi:FkbM family methyltransferase
MRQEIAELMKKNAMTETARSPIIRNDPRETQLPFHAEGLVNRVLTAAARALHRRGMLWRANFTVAGTLAGRPLRVPFQFGAGWEHLRMREVWLFHSLERVLRDRPGAFIDAGVNVGHTLVKVKTIDPGRDYIGFEPNPHCLRYTQQLITVNGFRHCIVVPVGISNRTGIMKLFMNPDADPSATIVEGFREASRYARWVPVPVFVGDDVLDTLAVDAVSVVKIDVEGGELDVVEGLQRTLRRYAPYIFCEVLPVFDEQTDMGRFRLERQTALQAMLHDLGYVIFRIHVDDTVEQVDEFGIHRDMTRSNYVFVPRAELGTFRRIFERNQEATATAPAVELAEAPF